MRVAPQITLDDKQRKILQRWSRGRSTPARLVLRARIVLLAAKGKQNKDIASEIGVDRSIVGRWRCRFARHGLAGVEKDAPRGGRKPTKRNKLARLIIKKTTEERPSNATHWSTRYNSARLFRLSAKRGSVGPNFSASVTESLYSFSALVYRVAALALSPASRYVHQSVSCARVGSAQSAKRIKTVAVLETTRY